MVAKRSRKQLGRVRGWCEQSTMDGSFEAWASTSLSPRLRAPGLQTPDSRVRESDCPEARTLCSWNLERPRGTFQDSDCHCSLLTFPSRRRYMKGAHVSKGLSRVDESAGSGTKLYRTPATVLTFRKFRLPCLLLLTYGYTVLHASEKLEPVSTAPTGKYTVRPICQKKTRAPLALL